MWGCGGASWYCAELKVNEPTYTCMNELHFTMHNNVCCHSNPTRGKRGRYTTTFISSTLEVTKDDNNYRWWAIGGEGGEIICGHSGKSIMCFSYLFIQII